MLAVLLAGFSMMVVAAPAALSAEPLHALAISVDGTHFFSATAPAALFPGGLTLVPGDRATSLIWLRNDSGVAATLSLGIVADATDSNTLLVGAETGDVIGDLLPLPTGGVIEPLLPDVEMASGAVFAVAVVVALPTLTLNDDQRTDDSFTLKITLGSDVTTIHAGGHVPTEPTLGADLAPNAAGPNPASPNPASPNPAPNAAASGGSGNALSWTGFAVNDWLLAAALLTATGSMLLVAVRRRREENCPQQP